MATYRMPIANLPVRKGERTTINVSVKNTSTFIARDMSWGFEWKAAVTPGSRAQETQMLDEWFQKLRLLDSKSDVVPGQGSFNTLNILLSDQDTDDVLTEKKRLYILIRVIWTDGSGNHESEACVFNYGDNNAFGICGSHTFIH